MTVRGDMEVMVASVASPRQRTLAIIGWLTEADVLKVIEAADVDIMEWIAGVAALREKIL